MPTPSRSVVCVPTASPSSNALDGDQVPPRCCFVSTTAASQSLLPPAFESQLSTSAYNRRRLNVLLHASTSRCIAVVVYRPGSADVTASFFTELADVLDRVSTFADPLILARDLNLRLERQHVSHPQNSAEFDLFSSRLKPVLDCNCC